MGWNDAALRDAVRAYEHASAAGGCAQKTIASYVRYALMFVDWRVGDSHTKGASGPNHARSHAATIDDLRADVDGYRHELRQRAGLSVGAVKTYAIHADQFVRWLNRQFFPGQRLFTAGSLPSRETLVEHAVASGLVAARRNASQASSPTPPANDVSWAWEGSVQESLVTWLQAAGWTIKRTADTKAGEHGVDIAARRGAERLLVEVKGYPQPTYARGVKAGEAKRWHPGAQARTYFGTGLHSVIILRDRATDGQVALALPDMPTYRSLLDQVRTALRDLGIRAFLVAADGSVRELRR